MTATFESTRKYHGQAQPQEPSRPRRSFNDKALAFAIWAKEVLWMIWLVLGIIIMSMILVVAGTFLKGLGDAARQLENGTGGGQPAPTTSFCDPMNPYYNPEWCGDTN